MNSSLVGQRRSSKALPEAKLALKSDGPCLVVYCLSDTLQLSKSWKKTITSEKYAQQIDEMHGKLQCLQLVLVKRMGPIFVTTTPNCALHNQCFKG